MSTGASPVSGSVTPPTRGVVVSLRGVCRPTPSETLSTITRTSPTDVSGTPVAVYSCTVGFPCSSILFLCIHWSLRLNTIINGVIHLKGRDTDVCTVLCVVFYKRCRGPRDTLGLLT